MKKRNKILSLVLAVMVFSSTVFGTSALASEVETNEGIENIETAGISQVEPENDDPGIFQYEKESAAIQDQIMPLAASQQKAVKAYGIDVSEFQGVIDWQKVKASGVKFAIIRVAYRGYGTGRIVHDSYALRNLQGAQAAGIEIGAYLHSTALNEVEAIEEAQYLVNIIKNYNITYPVAYDCEGYNDPNSRDYGLSKTQRTNNAIAFLDYVERQGYEPMMYASKNHLENDSQWEISRLETLFDTWVAHYPLVFVGQESYVDEKTGEILVRDVYGQYTSHKDAANSQTSYTRRYRVWQCASSGIVPGINGRVDLDIEYEVDSSEKNVRDFVQRLYKLILERNPDAAGFNSWVNNLMGQNENAADVTYGFVFSNEFIGRNLSNQDYVKILYRVCLNREADSAGLADWVDLLNGQYSRTYVLKGFIESVEFTRLCRYYGILRGEIGGSKLAENRDKNSQVTAFVRRYYNVFLSREPDVSGLNDWTGKILKSASQAREVPYGFVFSKEMDDKNLSDKDFVTILYKGIFDRNPDKEGLNDWMARLAEGSSRRDVYYGFVNADEFARLLKKYGL